MLNYFFAPAWLTVEIESKSGCRMYKFQPVREKIKWRPVHYFLM